MLITRRPRLMVFISCLITSIDFCQKTIGNKRSHPIVERLRLFFTKCHPLSVGPYSKKCGISCSVCSSLQRRQSSSCLPQNLLRCPPWQPPSCLLPPFQASILSKSIPAKAPQGQLVSFLPTLRLLPMLKSGCTKLVVRL